MSTQRRTRRLSAAALVMGLGFALLLGPLTSPASAASPVPAADSTFFSLLNSLRSTLGIGTLEMDPELSTIARAWSQQMAASGVMSHNPSLTSQAQGWAKLGENVGYGGAVTQIFNALVASPPHMRNMSDRDFTRFGVGTVTDSSGRLWTTHVFMRPRAQGASAAPAAAAPPATKAPAPATTKAPRPAPTTAAAATAPPKTVAPAPVPAPVRVPTTTAAAAVEVAGSGSASEAAAPVTASMAPASATPGPHPGIPVPLLVGAAMLALLVLCGAGFLLRHSTSSQTAAAEGPKEDLALCLDLPPLAGR